ncbi:hypothetical protein V6N13_076272 [Hibiscus sabdariffa]
MWGCLVLCGSPASVWGLLPCWPLVQSGFCLALQVFLLLGAQALNLCFGLQRLSCGKGLAAVTNVYFKQSPKTATVGSHPWRTRPLSGCLRPSLGLLGAVSAAWFVLPPQAALAATVGSNPRALLVPNSPCLVPRFVAAR